MPSKFGNSCCIVGVGETDIEPGKIYTNSWYMYIEAAKKAMDDAGVDKEDIDGLVFISEPEPPMPSFYASTFIEYTGLRPSYVDTLAYGGMPSTSAIYKAAMAIIAGLANVVLVVRGSNVLSRRKVAGVTTTYTRAGEPQWERPYGVDPLLWFGLMARRHMYEFGTTSEQMAAVAVAERKHASLHPNAQMREPITIQDVLNSRMLCEPIHLLDMCLISDGGGALIVTSSERAKSGFRKTPIYLSGVGQASEGHHILGARSSVSFVSCQIASATAFKMAGITPKDIDVAYLYDASTILVIIVLENAGFCKKGEGGPFVEGGRIQLGGELPVNTHGGLLSYRHYQMTLSSTIEAVRQLRGECGERQVKDAEVAFVHHAGGILTHTSMILRRA